MGKIRIDVYRQNYTVIIPSMKYKYLMEYMIVKLSTFGFRYDYAKKRTVREIDKIYASEDDHRMTYRFNINTIKNMMLVLGSNGITKDMLEIYRHDLVGHEELGLELNPNYVTKGYQQEYLDIIVDPDSKPFLLVDLIMGYGKTYISMAATTKLNMKTVILVLPKFIDKWARRCS